MDIHKEKSEVVQELKEMKRCGIRVPKKVFDKLADGRSDADIVDAMDSGMSMSELCDMLIEIA